MRWATWLVTFAVAALLLCALSTFTARASSDDDWKREVAVTGAPITKRLAVAIDATGSMHGAPHEKAARELLTIAGMFPDDGALRVWSFRLSPGPTLMVPGLPPVNTGYSPDVRAWRDVWTQLPDADAIDELAEWLAADGCGGGTDLVLGVAAALACPEDDLSAILVSDGEHESGPREAAVIEIIARSKRRGVPVHTIAVCADPESDGAATMAEIARGTGGTCVVWRGPGKEPR